MTFETITKINPDIEKIKKRYEELLNLKPEDCYPVFMGDIAEISFDTKQSEDSE